MHVNTTMTYRIRIMTAKATWDRKSGYCTASLTSWCKWKDGIRWKGKGERGIGQKLWRTVMDTLAGAEMTNHRLVSLFHLTYSFL